MSGAEICCIAGIATCAVSTCCAATCARKGNTNSCCKPKRSRKAQTSALVDYVLAKHGIAAPRRQSMKVQPAPAPQPIKVDYLVEAEPEATNRTTAADDAVAQLPRASQIEAVAEAVDTLERQTSLNAAGLVVLSAPVAQAVEPKAETPVETPKAETPVEAEAETPELTRETSLNAAGLVVLNAAPVPEATEAEAEVETAPEAVETEAEVATEAIVESPKVKQAKFKPVQSEAPVETEAAPEAVAETEAVAESVAPEANAEVEQLVDEAAIRASMPEALKESLLKPEATEAAGDEPRITPEIAPEVVAKYLYTQWMKSQSGQVYAFPRVEHRATVTEETATAPEATAETDAAPAPEAGESPSFTQSSRQMSWV